MDTIFLLAASVSADTNVLLSSVYVTPIFLQWSHDLSAMDTLLVLVFAAIYVLPSMEP
jgi:hypothetical protein